MEKIYFSGGNEATSVSELLKIGYKGKWCFEPTYHDELLTNRECNYGRRSFYDLLAIARTYFPETTEQELAKILIADYICFYCDDIKKLVFLGDTRYGHYYERKSFYTSYEDITGLSYNKIEELANQ